MCSFSDIDRRLRELGSYEGGLAQRSFGNDLLIAATARELGAMVVTRNLVDFELIQRVVPIRFQPPWAGGNALVIVDVAFSSRRLEPYDNEPSKEGFLRADHPHQ